MQMQLSLGKTADECFNLRHDSSLPFRRKLRPMAAVEEIDKQAGDKPGEEGGPCHDFKAHHENDAEDDAENRKQRPQRGAEAAAAFRLAIAQDEHSDGDQYEGEQRADVRKVRHGTYVKQSGGNADRESGDPCGECRGAELWVDAAEDRWQQAVAGHGKPHARLAELEDEDG